MNLLSLFSGIGGLDLGLERAGMTTIGQVEIDPTCREVLARHWPDVPRHDDARTAPQWWASTERPQVDVIAGGFPCQPFSRAGQQLGDADERWGWPWMERVIRLVRPRYVVVENVAALLDDRRAFGGILADLAYLGFDAEWSVLSACAVGAPHTRQRLFLVAYPHGVHGETGLGAGSRAPKQVPAGRRATGPWADSINRAMAANDSPDRVPNGIAAALVAAGGNAVVPQVAEYVGTVLMSDYS